MLMDNDEAVGGAPDIATPDEVLSTFTQLMRGEKSSEQLKAAEQLAKYHSLFTAKEEVGYRPELIAEIEAAVARISASSQSGAEVTLPPQAKPPRRPRKKAAAALPENPGDGADNGQSCT